jgi:O-antigen/teichoic acid export membrane protein
LTITTAAFVRFASDYERGDRAKVAKTLFAICRVCSLIILAIGGSICLSHEKLITGLSGHLWGNSSYCIAFMVNVTLVTFQSIFSTALNAMGYYKGQLHLYLVLLLIKASILYIFSAHLQASHILWITSGILLPMIGGNLWTIYQILARKSAIRGDSRE